MGLSVDLSLPSGSLHVTRPVLVGISVLLISAGGGASDGANGYSARL
jgi:hypothetical protein